MIASAVPRDLYSATNMYITVTGQNFVPTPTLILGPAVLREVTFVNSQTLTALIPWGLEPGSYPLTVTNPDGQSATLPDACTVHLEEGTWSSNGPYGGEVTDVFVDPANSRRVFVSVANSGLFVSNDAADYWEILYLDPMPTELVFQTCGNRRYLYFGMHAALLRSADEGATWERFLPDEVEEWLRRDPFDFHPSVNPDEPEAVYLGVSGNPGTVNGGGLFKYNCLTEEWIRFYPSNLHIMAVAFDPDDSDHIYFGTREGAFYRTLDGGRTWTGPITVSTHIQEIAVDSFLNSSGKHNIWVATNGRGYVGNGVFLSQDGGITFQRINNLPDPEAWVSAVTIHPTISGVIWLATPDGGYFTTDNGLHWSPVPGNLPWVWKFVLQPDPDAPLDLARTTVYAATWRGVYKSVNGGQTWQEVNRGLAGIIPESLAVNPQNPDEAYASTPSLGIVKTTDGGRNWQALGIPFGEWRARIAVDPFNPRVVYIPGGCYAPCVRISPDSGATYQTVTMPRPTEIPGEWSGRVMVIAPDPAQPGRLLAGAIFERYPVQNTYGAIYIRDNATAGWRIVKVLTGQVRYLYFDPHHSQRVYAATDAGLYRSEDRGETWNRMNTPASLKHISLVTAHPGHANVIYIYNWSAPGEDLSVQGIYISEDDGATWAMLTDEYGNKVYGGPVWEMRFAPVGPRVFYLATFDGLYRSLDDGHTLTPVEGLPGQANVQSLAFGHDVGLNGDLRLVIYAGTTGGYRIVPGTVSNTTQAARTDLMGAGVYRSSTVLHLGARVYLPLVAK
ncbi:MAG: hypothetical protein NZ821_05665 [Gloeomargarita sp. SKYB31]|nr:hypothetical protein [Gloeomargarita sp. SKYB31]